MKKCTHCTAENRDEAIFCTRCRRPLQAGSSNALGSQNVLVWLLVVLVLIGLGIFLFSSRSFLASTALRISTSTSTDSNELPLTRPELTRTPEPITLGVCIQKATIRIRRSPGTQSETLGGLAAGTCLTILGRNEEASWVYIVSDDHQTGWVDVSLLSDVGDLRRVSVRDPSGITNAARPTLTTLELAHGAQIYLTNVAATNLPQALLTRYMAPCFETADRIGEHTSCRMERAYCDYLPALEGSPSVCNDRPPPDQTFSVVVSGQDWSEYDGQCLIVSGYLEIANGALLIRAIDPSQVSPCE